MMNWCLAQHKCAAESSYQHVNTIKPTDVLAWNDTWGGGERGLHRPLPQGPAIYAPSAILIELRIICLRRYSAILHSRGFVGLGEKVSPAPYCFPAGLVGSNCTCHISRDLL